MTTVPAHGTRAQYCRGCRCDDCREANRQATAINRRKARERGYAGLKHGARSAYDAGCRCIACRRMRKRKAAEEVTIEGDNRKSESAAGDWHPTDDALSTEPRGGSRRMGTILTHPASPVTGTRREAEIRHQERQLCSTELLILAARSSDEDVACVLMEAAVAISRREVA